MSDLKPANKQLYIDVSSYKQSGFLNKDSQISAASKKEISDSLLKSEYQFFYSQYVGLKNQHSQTFTQKVFAEHVVMNGRKINISDEKSFEQAHQNLDTISSPKIFSNSATGTTKDTSMASVPQSDIDAVNQHVWSPWWSSYLDKCQLLIAAVKTNNYEEVARLINLDYNQDQAVNVNFQEAETGKSALHYAVELKEAGLVNLLVKNYADVRVQDANLQNPLHLACKIGDFQVFKQLIEACYLASESLDVSKKTPLDIAQDNGHTDLVKFIKQMTVVLFSDEEKNKDSQTFSKHMSVDNRALNRKTARNTANVRTKDFKRIALLGQGSYAEVYLVQKLSSKRYYAMKRMKKRTYNGLTKFVITEKEVQRKIDHHYVVPLNYAFQTFDYLYMVSEFCPGENVRALITSSDNGYLLEDIGAFYLAQILTGIEEIHKNGIVHRDIKPENCLINSKGHACLADFGLAKQGFFEQQQTDTLLGGGQTYQIPEVLRGESYGKSVDLYLYGVLMYEMLVGCSAFPAFEDIDEHEQRIKTCRFFFPGESGFQEFKKKYPSQFAKANQNLSASAKDLIRGLIVADGSDRLTVAQIKSHQFFKDNLAKAGVNWTQIQKGTVDPPVKCFKEPIADNFEEIQYDSDDNDFEHEFTDLYQQQQQSLVGLEKQMEFVEQNLNKSDGSDGMPQPDPLAPREMSMAMSQDSNFYNAQPDDFDDDQKQILENFDEIEKVKVPGFSFVGKRETVLGQIYNAENSDASPKKENRPSANFGS